MSRDTAPGQENRRARLDARVSETVATVDKHETVGARLKAAMGELRADTLLLIERGDKAEQLKSVEDFAAHEDEWVSMVLGRAASQKAK